MPAHRDRHKRPKALPSIPAEAALSFLKDTKGALTWTARDLADTLTIDRSEAEQILAFLQAQGYVQPNRRGEQAHQRQPAHGTNDWITTPAGETVSGAKPPRFTHESIEQALAALKERIKQSNKDPQAPFRITDAIAFGDFLLPDRARAQSAEVGIRLKRAEDLRRGAASATEPRSASDAQAERKFLRDLRAKSALLNLRPYADWMRHRTHRALV
jgi:hypothetical protein